MVSLIVSMDGFSSSMLSLFSLANSVVVLEDASMARGRIMVVVDEKDRDRGVVVKAVVDMFVDAMVSAATMAVLLLLRRVVLIILVIF